MSEVHDTHDTKVDIEHVRGLLRHILYTLEEADDEPERGTEPSEIPEPSFSYREGRSGRAILRDIDSIQRGLTRLRARVSDMMDDRDRVRDAILRDALDITSPLSEDLPDTDSGKESPTAG